MTGYISCGTDRSQNTLTVEGLWSSPDDKTIGGYEHSIFQNGSWRYAGKHMISSGPKTYWSFSFVWGGLSAGTTYPVRIQWFTADGNTSRGFSEGTCRTADPPSPPPSTPTSFRVYDKPNSTSLSLAWDTVSGATGYIVRVTRVSNGQLIGDFGSTSGSVYVSGLVNGVTYNLRLHAYNASGDSGYTFLNNVKAGPDRPNEWEWTIAKTKGRSYNISNNRFTNLVGYSEIIAFRSRINEFRVFKGLDAYSFVSMPQGAVFTATMYNSLRNAINEMNPPTPTLSPSYTVDVLLNRLRDSLNSIV